MEQTKCRDGLLSWCKQCCLKNSKAYKKENAERVLRAMREWYEENAEEKKAYQRQYRKDNLEEVRKRDKEYRQSHRKKTNLYYKERRKNNPVTQLSRNISSMMSYSLKNGKNGQHWEDLAGWTAEECRARLESLFTEGMSWDNYGRGGWVVDHIIAICRWNITSTECQAFKGCWSLDNLQPLWDIRNMEKGSKPMHPKYLIKPKT